jgi:uncharacterized delta-60 repeat protein
MTLIRWLRSCFAPRPASRNQPRAPRLAVEQLEDRLTPSTGGVLDPTFGSGGQVMTSFTNNYDSAQAVTVQSDGKFLIVGNSLVARYNANGTLDTGFGSGGHTTTGIGSDNAVALEPQANGPSKILVAGTTSKGDALARYNADGTLDTTFGKKGEVVTALGGPITSMVVDSAGRILVGGFNSGGAFLARYNANGSLDTTFGSGGEVLTSIPVANAGREDSLALEADGKIVLAAAELDPAQSTHLFEVARFNSNGTLDSTFGTGGVVKTLVGGGDDYGGLAVQADGKIVVAGSDTNGNGYPLYLVRYNTDGTLDNTFGSSGVVSLTNAGAIVPTADGVAVQSDGSIVVGGDDGAALFAVRVGPTGALDTGYGNGGWAFSNLPYGGGARAIALQPDGSLVVAGYARPTTNISPTDVDLVRFLGSAPQIGSFTASPSPAPAGSSVTLTAAGISDGNPNSTTTQVAFYLDSNNDGKLETGSGGDQLLGYGTKQPDGSWTFNWSTTGLTAGTYTLFAQAEDSDGVFGDPFSQSVTLT